MGRLGPLEILGILAIIILLFGAKRLPDTARALGRSMRILKDETKGGAEEKKTEKGTDSGESAPH